MFLLENGVGSYGSVEQFQQIVFLERLEHVELTTGEQRANHLERGILGGSTNQRDNALLDSSQEGILLRLGETMNLVDKQNGRSLVEESAFLGLLNHIAHILHTTRHSRECIEGCFELVGNDLG